MVTLSTEADFHEGRVQKSIKNYIFTKVNFRAIYSEIYKFANDRVKKGNYNAWMRKFEIIYRYEIIPLRMVLKYLQVHYLLIIKVSSDFISEGRDRFTLSID